MVGEHPAEDGAQGDEEQDQREGEERAHVGLEQAEHRVVGDGEAVEMRALARPEPLLEEPAHLGGELPPDLLAALLLGHGDQRELAPGEGGFV